MKKQQPILIIDNPEAAKAVREAQFLGYFLEPSSPSDVAKRAGIAANLMHHHANRYLELGLLFEVKRENRKVFYQLRACLNSSRTHFSPTEPADFAARARGGKSIFLKERRLK